MENREKSGFAHARLPWLIVVAALMVYVLTLNRWVSLASLAVVAGVANPEAALGSTGRTDAIITCRRCDYPRRDR